MKVSSFNIQKENINNNISILDELENVKSYIDCFELTINQTFNKELNKEDKLSNELNKTIIKINSANKGINILNKENKKLNLQLKLIKEIQNLVIGLPYMSIKYKTKLLDLCNNSDKYTISQLENQINKIKSINN